MAKRVIGNWKMFGRQVRNAELVAALLADPACDAGHVSLGVPTVYLGQVASLLSGRRTGLAAQDVSRFSADGAYTGEVSAAMLADCGCREVLLGHSERRQYFGENDASLRLKVEAVYAAARGAGSSRVYWLTQDANVAGRALYDKVARHAGFIVYAHEL